MSDQEESAFTREMGTYYVPEGESRTLRFVDWYSYQNGVLFAPVVVEEAETDETLLLRQYGADLLTVELARHSPRPNEWVRVRRKEGSGYDVEFGELEDLTDAM